MDWRTCILSPASPGNLLAGNHYNMPFGRRHPDCGGASDLLDSPGPLREGVFLRRQIMRSSYRLSLSVLLVLCLHTFSSATQAEQQDSQQYLHWAKFKPGSMVTMAGEVEATGSKVQIDLTSTLVSVTPEKVVLQDYSTLHLGGHDQKNPGQQRDVPAKEEKKAEIKQLADEEIQAAGRKFKCKVYESVEIATSPDAKANKAKAKIWLSDEVPGGAVKMQLINDTGTTTFTLKSFEVK